MRSLLTILFFISFLSYSDNWLPSEDGFGLLSNRGTNYTEWAGQGSLTIASQATYLGTAFNQNSYGCGGATGWCLQSVYNRAVSFSGGAINFKTQVSNSGPVGTTGGEFCYFSTLAGIVGPAIYSLPNSSLRSTTQAGSTGYMLSSVWTKVNKACKDLTMSSPELSNLILPVAPYNGYILLNDESLNCNSNCDSSVMGGNSVTVKQYGFKGYTQLKPSARIVACSSPSYSASGCSVSFPAYGSATITPDIPKTKCAADVPLELNFGSISTADYNQKVAQDNILFACTGQATIEMKTINDGKVKIGPFNVKVTLDDQVSTKVDASKQSSVVIKAVITGTNSEPEPGSYEGSIVLITSVL